MQAPFPYDKISSGETFYGRKASIKLLGEIANSGSNILIFSKRRMGKSSLISQFFLEQKDEFITIYVDIFDIISKEDFARELLKGVSNATKLDIKSAMQKMMSLFKRARVEPSVDVNTMEISLKPIVATLSFEEMMSDFFESVESLAKEKRVIVAIDEFQQIAEIKDIKLDAYLRKEIQQRSKNVSYFFLGSKRHLLTSLFEYKAPLYEMARHYELPSLELSEIRDYVTRYIEISDFLLEYVCEICDYETKMLQHMFHILYVRKEDITKETIDRARDEIIGSKDSSYRMVYDSLSSTQKIALKAVGKYKGGFFAQEVLQEYNITKQSMQSAINLLSKKELIDKEGQKYFIPDRVFELWIERL